MRCDVKPLCKNILLPSF